MQKLLRIQKRRTAADRSKILAAYRASGLTQPEFCRQQRLGKSTLQLWLRKSHSAQPVKSGGFVPLPNLLASVSGRPPVPDYRLRFPRGVELEIASGFKADEVARLLELLQRL